MSKLQNDLLKAFAESIKLPDTRSLDQWVQDNVTLPAPPYNLGGKVDLSLSPYLIEPLKAISDPTIREVCIAGSPRTGKSMIHDFVALYTLKVDHGDLLFVLDTLPKAREWHKTRWNKLFSVNGITYSEDRFDTSNNLILFPQLTMRFAGAKNETGLSSFPSRIILMDECWRYPQGIMQHARSRCLEFSFNHKIICVSQASESGDDFYGAWHRGDCCLWSMKCPQCNHIQPYVISEQREDGSYGGLQFHSAKVNNKWDVPLAGRIAEYECIKCRQRFKDNAHDRRLLRESSLYVTKNDNPSAGVRSFRWNAFSSENYTYGQIAMQYLLAKQEKDNGKPPDLKTFYMQTMVEFWRYNLTEEEVEPLVATDGKTFDTANEIRICTADVQERDNEIFYTIMGFNREKKEARLIQHGIVNNFDELHQLAKTHGVKDQRTYVDSGNGNQTRRIYRECAKHGHWGKGATSGKRIWYRWNPTKGGAEKKMYFHKEKNKNEFFAIPSHQATGLDVSGQRTVELVLFNTDVAKTLLKELLDNRHSEWKLYISELAKADKVFNEHLNAEKLEPVRNKKTNAMEFVWTNSSGARNDYWDSMVLQMVGAAREGLL